MANGSADSGTATAQVTDNAGLTSAPATTYLTIGNDSPPVIQNFSATHLGGNQWLLTGNVVDANGNAGLTVEFGGDPQSLQGLTATTAADGSFSVIANMTNGAQDSGTATAQVTDSQGLVSDPVSTPIYIPVAPTITNFTCQQIDGTSYLFSGTVQDESPAGLTVSFGRKSARSRCRIPRRRPPRMGLSP